MELQGRRSTRFPLHSEFICWFRVLIGQVCTYVYISIYSIYQRSANFLQELIVPRTGNGDAAAHNSFDNWWRHYTLFGRRRVSVTQGLHLKNSGRSLYLQTCVVLEELFFVMFFHLNIEQWLQKVQNANEMDLRMHPTFKIKFYRFWKRKGM
jgi:hypothetical protein